jgi:hypothetical protein
VVCEGADLISGKDEIAIIGGGIVGLADRVPAPAQGPRGFCWSSVAGIAEGASHECRAFAFSDVLPLSIPPAY